MRQDDIRIFNSEIDKRLTDSIWSSEIAAAVLKKDQASAADRLLSIFAWIMPSLAAASIVYFFILSTGMPLNKQFTQDQVYSYISDISDIEFSVIDELL